MGCVGGNVTLSGVSGAQKGVHESGLSRDSCIPKGWV